MKKQKEVVFIDDTEFYRMLDECWEEAKKELEQERKQNK